MEKEFYKGRLKEKFDIEVLVPDEEQRALVHKVIYNELCLGKINDESRAAYLAIINNLRDRGAQAVILGCTEIAMLVSQKDSNIPLYDTTTIHAIQAVKYALDD